MKYLKLFENWLNEAEGGVKPFDPMKPDETLVVDITEEDLYKDPKVMHIILQSMFNRGVAKKDSPDVPEVINVIPLYVGWSKQVNPKEPWHVKDNMFKGFYVRETNGEEYTVVNKIPIDDYENTMILLENLLKEKTPIFLVTNANDNWFEKNEDGNLLIKLNNKNMLLLPKDLSGKWLIENPKGFALNSKIQTRDGERRGGFYKQVLSGIVESISGIGTSGWCNSTGRPTQAAKILGYEIPDNYTPKMGGIEKTKR
jgi:hypothetical protein